MNGLPNGIEEEGSLGMYSIRPFDLPADIPLPTCMYRMSPINSPIATSDINIGTGTTSRGTLTQEAKKSLSTTSTSTGSDMPTSPPTNDMVESLELRQLQIIDKLTKLRDMITGIHEKCVVARNISGVQTSAVQDGNKSVLSDDNIDIVVHANPESPPFTLILFARLLENSYSNAVVSINSHLHSSFKGTINKGHLQGFDKGETDANVRFTIIWKNVPCCNMIVSPVSSPSIKTEANIARFLSRLLPVVDTSLNYDSLRWDTLVKVDSLLDQADETKVISVIETALKKSEQGFLAGELTVADLVLYSSVASRVLKGLKEKDIPVAVKKWVKRLEVGFGVFLLGLSG